MTAVVAIVAHGQPGDPAPMQAELERFAASVAPHLPGAQVIGATLADTDSLIPARHATLIYPLFMADGWFTRTEMPRRLRAALPDDDAPLPPVLPPLGLDEDLPAIGRRLAFDAAEAAGMHPARVTLVVAGHGSRGSDQAAEACRAFAGRIDDLGGFHRVVTGFIEQAPFLADAARIKGAALCLPFFATAAAHVTRDIPEAMAEAAMTGPVTPPVGLAPEVPALIARRLSDALESGMVERSLQI